MKYNQDKHHRRSIRLKEYDYSQPGAYFITICTYDKKCIFGEIIQGKMILNELGNVVTSEWIKTAEIRKNVKIDEYVVMPNHLHGMIMIMDRHNVGATPRVAPTEERPKGPAHGSIGAIIGQFKSIVTKQINAIRGNHKASVWQRNYYEHIIRNEDELNEIREYIVGNPMKWESDEENPVNLRKP